MKIYNTLTREKEEFVPISGKKVNLFVCGPTTYDFAHIGNAKTYTQFDFMVRYLRFRGYEVFYLQNITDVDDKIINRAREKSVPWNELSDECEKIYFEDMERLRNISVTEYAKATNYIDQIVKQVQTLMDKGYAYISSDGIYYDIKKFSDYGKLAGRTEADQDAGVSRIDEGLDKRNRNDFCLWKFYRDGEPFWETPLGKGRPGWHIEDTAITETFFGPQYDIHGGAVDLIFPHHEAEIAQMEAASGRKPLVKYWVHTAFLNMGKEKMSKSKGNFWTIRDVLKQQSPRVLRMFFISSHYRTPLEFSEKFLDQAAGGLQRIDDFLGQIDAGFDDSENQVIIDKYREKIFEALDDDFDTPKAFALIFEFIHELNIKGGIGEKVAKFFGELDQFFGFMALEKENVPGEISSLADERVKLRLEGKFSEADEVREKIEKMGYTVSDTAEGSRIVKK